MKKLNRLFVSLVLLASGCGEGEKGGGGGGDPPSQPRHFCDDHPSLPPEPEGIEAKLKFFAKKKKAEDAFYAKYWNKTFRCSKSNLEMIWLDYGKGLWMSSQEVSRGVYQQVMDVKASEKKKNLPMNNLSIDEMVAFCDKLTDCWRRNSREKLPDIFKFDLPTANEWHDAAGGNTGYYNLTSNDANFNGGFPPRGTTEQGPFLNELAPVDYASANEKGFFNMWGNVKEVCNYNYHTESTASWVSYGGSFLSKGNGLGVRERRPEASEDLGFRIVLVWIGPEPIPE